MVALIRSLPKQLRVNFVPAPNFARDVPRRGRRRARSRCSTRSSGSCAPAPGSSCPATPGTGRRCPTTCGRPSGWSTRTASVVGEGKDLEALKAPLRPKFAEAMAEAAAASGLDVTGQTTWTFGTIERTFTQTRAGHEVRGFPALVDEGADGRAAGVRLRGRAGGRRTAAACAGCCCWPCPSPARADRRRAGQRRQARARRVAVPVGRRRCSRTASPPPSTRWSTGTAGRSGTRPAFDALVDRRCAPTWRRRPGACVHDVVRVLAVWREVDKAAERLGRPADAAGADRHEGAGRPAGAPRVRRRRRAPRSCGTCRATSAAVRTRRERLAAARRPRPAADGPGRARCRRPTCTASTRCPTGRPPSAGAASRCAGCSRSTGSASGPSPSARRTRSPTPGSARPSTRV